MEASVLVLSEPVADFLERQIGDIGIAEDEEDHTGNEQQHTL